MSRSCCPPRAIKPRLRLRSWPHLKPSNHRTSWLGSSPRVGQLFACPDSFMEDPPSMKKLVKVSLCQSASLLGETLGHPSIRARSAKHPTAHSTCGTRGSLALYEGPP